MTNAPPTTAPHSLALRVLDVGIVIDCLEPDTAALLGAHYRRLRGGPGAADLRYTVARSNGALMFSRDGAPASVVADPGDLLLALDQDLLVRLQRIRHDLYFVHAAVLEFRGAAVMLVAPSGGGKSTTAWGLVHHGCPYLSDELAPVDLTTLTVHPYPRSLLLKAPPPAAYPLPPGTLVSSRGFHVAPDALAGGIRESAAVLQAIFFVRYVPHAPAPSVVRMSAAHAGARLYANALNALAHPEDGLDAAIRIARASVCFQLTTADMAATCALVRATLEGLRPV